MGATEPEYDPQMTTRFVMSLFSAVYQLEILLPFRVGISYAYPLTILLYLLEISGMFVLDNDKEKEIHFF